MIRPPIKKNPKFKVLLEGISKSDLPMYYSLRRVESKLHLLTVDFLKVEKYNLYDLRDTHTADEAIKLIEQGQQKIVALVEFLKIVLEYTNIFVKKKCEWYSHTPPTDVATAIKDLISDLNEFRNHTLEKLKQEADTAPAQSDALYKYFDTLKVKEMEIQKYYYQELRAVKIWSGEINEDEEEY